MTKGTTVSVLVLAAFLGGCASRAASIPPVAIPSSNYAGLSCEDTKTMLEAKMQAQTALTKAQNNAATGDAVGVALLLLPVGSIFGSDKAGELAQAKGEVLALQGAEKINCKTPPPAGHN